MFQANTSSAYSSNSSFVPAQPVSSNEANSNASTQDKPFQPQALESQTAKDTYTSNRGELITAVFKEKLGSRYAPNSLPVASVSADDTGEVGLYRLLADKYADSTYRERNQLRSGIHHAARLTLDELASLGVDDPGINDELDAIKDSLFRSLYLTETAEQPQQPDTPDVPEQPEVPDSPVDETPTPSEPPANPEPPQAPTPAPIGFEQTTQNMQMNLTTNGGDSVVLNFSHTSTYLSFGAPNAAGSATGQPQDAQSGTPVIGVAPQDGAAPVIGVPPQDGAAPASAASNGESETQDAPEQPAASGTDSDATSNAQTTAQPEPATTAVETPTGNTQEQAPAPQSPFAFPDFGNLFGMFGMLANTMSMISQSISATLNSAFGAMQFQMASNSVMLGNYAATQNSAPSESPVAPSPSYNFTSQSQQMSFSIGGPLPSQEQDAVANFVQDVSAVAASYYSDGSAMVTTQQSRIGGSPYQVEQSYNQIALMNGAQQQSADPMMMAYRELLNDSASSASSRIDLMSQLDVILEKITKPYTDDNGSELLQQLLPADQPAQAVDSSVDETA